MKRSVVFPTLDARLPFNISLTFDVSDFEEVVEVVALDLPDNVVILIERAFQLDGCADLTWVLHKEPCCDDPMRIASSGPNVLSSVMLSIPSKYRLTLALTDPVGNLSSPSAIDVGSVKILTSHMDDQSGTVRNKHVCCKSSLPEPTFCDMASDLNVSATLL